MTVTLNPTVKGGSVVTARTSDTATLVWFYVIALLPDGRAFGVNLGTNANTLNPEGTGVRFDTATVEHYGEADTLARLSREVADALASFLVAAGLQDPREQASTPRVQGDQDTDQAYQRGVADGRAERDALHQASMDRLVSDAHEWADSNSLCSEFDRFMEEHGLAPREREHEIEYRVTMTVEYVGTASVTATSWDEAHDMFHENESEYVDFDTARRYGDITDREVECA